MNQIKVEFFIFVVCIFCGDKGEMSSAKHIEKFCWKSSNLIGFPNVVDLIRFDISMAW